MEKGEERDFAPLPPIIPPPHKLGEKKGRVYTRSKYTDCPSSLR